MSRDARAAVARARGFGGHATCGMLALGVAALVAGCGTQAPVRIGVAMPASVAAAATLAADDINAAGGIGGRRVEIVFDTSTDGVATGEMELERAQRLIARGPFVAVVGHGSSHGSLAAAPVYNDAEVVQLVPAGTSRLLDEAGPWTLRMAPDDSVEGAYLASYARDVLRGRSVMLFYLNDAYGLGLRSGLRAALGGAGTRIVREQRFDSHSAVELLVEAAFRGAKADVAVIVGGMAQTAGIARRVLAVSPRTLILCADAAASSPGFAALLGTGGAGVHVAAFWLPDARDSASRRFAAALERRLGRGATAGDAMVYDAVRVVATAVGVVGHTPAAVRTYLLSLGRSRPAYPGITGPIGFGRTSGTRRFVMGVVRDGRLERADSVAT